LVNVDISEIAKYLQGKTFKEIKSILIKISRSKREEVIKRLAEIEKERRAFGEKAVRIPEVKWADVGGLAAAKEDIM
jgi:SpoVK/Ycf46/Vps4 family AAA+-type ATPase